MLEAIGTLQSVLNEVRFRIDAGDWQAVTEWPEQARNVRRSMPGKTNGLLGQLFGLKVLVRDKPRILAHSTKTLAEATINTSGT
jgi:hypothetical protein